MKKLTKAQRGRLEKLAAYLEGLPEDYAHFDMISYIEGTNDEAILNYARKNGGVSSCGTAACAVGHGPAAGILMPPRLLGKMGYGTWDDPQVWNQYSALFIGTNDGGDFADPNRFDWLFSSDWRHYDNHHHGAAARIRYMLEHGLPDDDLTRGQQMALYQPYRIDAKATA